MSDPSSSTKDRIVEEAMRLFGEKGYKGASVAQIEAAAGLSPGAGGLYRHFESKEALLSAGIRRHLDRLDAFRDVRQALSVFGDLPTMLEAAARYYLEELDSQTELFRVVLTERRSQPQLLTEAVEELISSTFRNFAEWLVEVSNRELDAKRALTISNLALGSLLSSRLLRNVVGVESITVSDDAFVAEWVEMLLSQLSGS
jgi:AcrR family transcriptional regulator